MSCACFPPDAALWITTEEFDLPSSDHKIFDAQSSALFVPTPGMLSLTGSLWLFCQRDLPSQPTVLWPRSSSLSLGGRAAAGGVCLVLYKVSPCLMMEPVKTNTLEIVWCCSSVLCLLTILSLKVTQLLRVCGSELRCDLLPLPGRGSMLYHLFPIVWTDQVHIYQVLETYEKFM